MNILNVCVSFSVTVVHFCKHSAYNVSLSLEFKWVFPD